MVDSGLRDGDASPLDLAFLKLEDDSPSSSFDPLTAWLLDPDKHNPRAMSTACSDPYPIDSEGTQLPPSQESCDLGDGLLAQLVVSLTSECDESPEGAGEKSKEVDALETACGGGRVEKGADLMVKMEPLDEDGCQQEPGVADLPTTGCEGNGVEKGADLSVKMESLGEGECRQELKKPEHVGGMVNESELDEESEGESDVERESSSNSEEEDEEEDEVAVKEDGVSSSGSEEDVEEVENREVRNSEMEELILSSDEEDGGVVRGPIRSKNEIADLSPVPPVNVVLGPHHQTLPVGVISSMIGSQVIVDGSMKHNPLNEGSILWITETRSPLGLVDEIFGPVKNPYYVVRYNSVNEVPAEIHEGTAVSFVAEFSSIILNQNDLHKKGYDASGENDEEVSDEVEFSDDEKEAEYRSLKPPKRGMVNQAKFNHDSNNRKNNRFRSRKPPKRGMVNKGIFFQDSNNKKNSRFKGSRLHSHVQYKPSLSPPEAGTGKAASHLPMLSPLPSISGGGEAKDVLNRLIQPCGSIHPTVPSIPQAVQAGDFFGVQPPTLFQQQPGSMWMPEVTTQQQNIGIPMTAQQQPPGLPGGFGVNAPFQYQQQPQQTQPQLQQQQLFPGLSTGFINGFPFQQQISSCQASLFNLPLLSGKLNSSNGPMPMGLPNFGQPPSASSNCIANPAVPVINMELFGQLASAALPGNVHPAMQFNMGSLSNYRSFRPSNARCPFGKRGHP